MTNKRCKDWCDTFASVYPVKSYCSDECKSAGRSVNEKDKPEAGRTCANWKDCGKYSVSAREKLWCSFECRDAALNPAPSPVERCSCAESVVLRKALDEIAAVCTAVSGSVTLEIGRIARRALELGGETET